MGFGVKDLEFGVMQLLPLVHATLNVSRTFVPSKKADNILGLSQD